MPLEVCRTADQVSTKTSKMIKWTTCLYAHYHVWLHLWSCDFICMVQWWWCFMLTYVQEFYHFLQHQRAKSVKSEYGFLHDNLPQTLLIWYLFTVTSPNMDFETTFFGQLKKPCHALILPSVLQEVVKLLYHMYMYQCVIKISLL